MPRLNGLEATRQILKHLPDTRIIILSAHSEDAYFEQAMRIGAAGYLIKQTSLLVLAKAIREASKGNPYFCPTMAKRLRDSEKRSKNRGELHSKKIATLTSREVEVLQLVAEGKANKETASELNISIKTVEKHRQALMEKLNIHDTASLTRYAISAGIIENSVNMTII